MGRAEHGFFTYTQQIFKATHSHPLNIRHKLLRFLGSQRRRSQSSAHHFGEVVNKWFHLKTIIIIIKLKKMQFLSQDSIFLGSDYPFLLGEHRPGINDREKYAFEWWLEKKLLSENVCKFLDMWYQSIFGPNSEYKVLFSLIDYANQL